MIQNTTEPYTQVGGTVYGIDDYTIVVFEYAASGTQSITFNQAINNMSMLVVGGGGGGGQNDGGVFGGGGGGGGGIYYLENDTPILTKYNITVGSGKNTTSSGGNSTVTFEGFNILSIGGSTTTNYNSGASGYSSTNYTKGTTYNGGDGSQGYSLTSEGNGQSSGLPSLQITTNIALYLSGGGGGAVQTVFDTRINTSTPAGLPGKAGLGIGGISGGITNSQNGENGIYIFNNNNGFGGGGGGTAGFGNPNASTGYGGNGVVIFWWPNT